MLVGIYSKLQKIQSEVKELVRSEENKFQKYFFFNELQVMKLLKPLLEKYQLAIFISDDTSQPFFHEISDSKKEHYIRYLKKIEVVDVEKINEKLFFNFWACGSNPDLSKAKGASDTYAAKYILSKLFLIPVRDEEDPDYQQQESNAKINSFFSVKRN